MILYHFTSLAHWKAIQGVGLTRGDVPTGPTEGFNAVWLTDDLNAGAQGWAAGSIYDKSAVRLTVSVRKGPKLKHWSKFAKKIGVPQWWYDALDKAGGGNSEHWYIHLSAIPMKNIKDVAFKE